MNFFVRSSTELETYMVATERIKEYSDLETEVSHANTQFWVVPSCILLVQAPYEIEETAPSSLWPAQGTIEYSDYSTRYRPELDLVLKNLNISIRPCEKVGIVGRTGAGKSSMALSLFRIIEPTTGSIVIDDVDVRTLGLHNLRSKLTIIPQVIKLTFLFISDCF